ncbi:MAG: GIY-YIG nuclease family protein [Chloroflexi bacterium]|nr:GIY-YIG nuclease family protein [Chloroflexota bacterium]
MLFFIYILRNPEGRFYIGQTSDLSERLRRHKEGRVFWTKSRGPWELACSRQFETRSEAVCEERRLKGLKSKKALEAYIAQQVESRPVGINRPESREFES